MYYYPKGNKVLENHNQIRVYLSNTLFSSVITEDQLEYAGIESLKYEPPAVQENQIAVPSIIEFVDGVWTQQWEIRLGTPEELAAMKPTVSTTVTRRQARQALLLRGMLDKVPAAIQRISDETQRALAQIEWEDSQTFERHRPLVVEIAAAIGLDDAGLDALFIEAARL